MPKELNETEKEHILKQFETIKDQFSFPSEGLSDIISGSDSKLIECQHEIIINVIGKVYEENAEGQTVSAKEICQQNYHIPVPPLKDYKEYLTGFFRHLEECIVQSVEINKNQTDNEHE